MKRCAQVIARRRSSECGDRRVRAASLRLRATAAACRAPMPSAANDRFSVLATSLNDRSGSKSVSGHHQSADDPQPAQWSQSTSTRALCAEIGGTLNLSATKTETAGFGLRGQQRRLNCLSGEKMSPSSLPVWTSFWASASLAGGSGEPQALRLLRGVEEERIAHANLLSESTPRRKIFSGGHVAHEHLRRGLGQADGGHLTQL